MPGLLALIVGVLLHSQSADSQSPTVYTVIPEESVLAVVTHKAGFASGLAHDHFVAAGDQTSRLIFDEDDPLTAWFEAAFPVDGLIVDDPGLKEAWYPRLEALDVLEDPFKEMSEDDRETVREKMLEDGQLDGAAFPTVFVKVADIEEKESQVGDQLFPYELLLELTVRDTPVYRRIAARHWKEGDALLVEAVGVYYFTDFGIEPYSAFMGGVRNQNEFHLYLRLKAVPEV